MITTSATSQNWGEKKQKENPALVKIYKLKAKKPKEYLIKS
jgi:hypothetical protein